MSDTSIFTVTESEPGSFSLCADDFERYEKTFDACGHEGGGYDWEAVVRQIIREHAPHLSKIVRFDSESSMFCANGHDKAALLELAVLMKEIFSDSTRLAAAIGAADPDWFDKTIEEDSSSHAFVVVINFASMIDDELLDSFESNLPPRHEFECGMVGAVESNIVIETDAPHAAFDDARPILQQFGWLESATVAFRPADGDDFTVVWPKEFTGEFEPDLL